MTRRLTNKDAQEIPEYKREQPGVGVRGKHYNQFLQGSNEAVLLSDSKRRVVEFISRVEDGRIVVPKTIHLAEGQPVRVLILLDEAAASKDAVESDAGSVWERTSGAWQGDQLVRELHGNCDEATMKVPVSQLKDSDLQKAPQALMRAAEKARQLAEQTGTPFVTRPAGTAAKTDKQK